MLRAFCHCLEGFSHVFHGEMSCVCRERVEKLLGTIVEIGRGWDYCVMFPCAPPLDNNVARQPDERGCLLVVVVNERDGGRGVEKPVF